MFESIFVEGTLIDKNGRPVANRRGLVLQINALGRGWSGAVKVATNREGGLRGEVRTPDFANASFAPQFRLFDGETEKVISQVYEATLLEGGELEVRFGKISLDGTISDESGDLKERLADAEKRIMRLNEENDGLAKQGIEKTKQIEELEEKLRTKGNTLDNVATEEITRLKTQLVSREVDFAQLSAQKAATDAALAAANQESETLKSDLSLIRDSDAGSPLITDLAGSVAKSLGDASRSATGASAFAVSDAHVTLKGYLADGGQRFKPLDAAELSRSNVGAASEISFRLKPTSDQTVTGQQMPDVVGLTPASARRILRPLGNQMQIIETEGKPAGGIVAQVPRAGQALAADAIIRLTVATGPAEEG